MGMEKIRIGILTDTDYTPAWAYEMVRMVKELSYVEIVLVVTNKDKTENHRGIFRKIWDRLGILVTVAYLILDQRIFRSGLDAFSARSFKNLLPNADWISVTPKKTKFRDCFIEEDINIIYSYNLDILLCRGFRILSGEILKVPKYGVWSYHHGNNAENRGRPAIFHETLQNWSNIGTILQILNEELDNGLVLYKSISGHRSRFVFRNMNSVYWKSSFFFLRCIEELSNKGWEHFIADKKELNPDISTYDRPLYTIPSNSKALAMLGRHFLRICSEHLRSVFFEDQWHIAYLKNADVTRLTFHRFQIISIPRDRFWADPFVVDINGKTYIYFEEYHKKSGKGKISVLELPAKGKPSYKDAVTVLERPYHLSYPYMFWYKGDLYMIPESANNNSVDLYRCSGNPSDFKYVRTLLSGIKALDSTLLFYKEKCWLFANTVPHPAVSSYEELSLFYSDDLLNGAWVPHPANPIVSDVRSSRPAGNIIQTENGLYRPAQNCTPIYGYGINLQKITEITEITYREEAAFCIEPLWHPKVKTTHTLSHCNTTVVIDLALKKSKFL